MKQALAGISILLLCLGFQPSCYAQLEVYDNYGDLELYARDGYIGAEHGLFVPHSSGNRSEISTISFGNALTFTNWDAGSIYFYTGTTPSAATLRMVIHNDGNVGIGAPTPSTHLELQGEEGEIVLLTLNQTGTKAWTGLRLDRTNTEKWFVGMDAFTDELVFRRDASTNDMRIDENGYVGIGRSPATYQLEVGGDALKTSGGNTWQTSSDRRLKDIRGPYDQGLDAILQLCPVTFRYKEDNPRGLPTEEDQVGFVGQEVQKIFPEAVTEGKDGYLDFNMHAVNVAIINAIKQLKAENDALSTEIKELRQAFVRQKENF
jgi:hypothetical protein